MSPKITLIGAGSVVFAKSLLSDILQFPEFSEARICLMDIDPARLKVAGVMTEKIISALKIKATVQATLSQKEAVRGANYVICTIQVGGYKPSTVVDFEIPKKYGLKQTIADTLGVGGVFRALRTIPVINSIAQDIADLGAPGCLLLNYTNPMAMNCWAVDRAVGIPHVGLCHSVQGTSKTLATLVGLPYEDVTFLVAGINHMAFFLKFQYRGQDAYPLLFKFIERGMPPTEKVRFEMMRRTGYFVTESSEHQSEYVPYFIHHGESVIQKFDIPIDEYIRRCEGIISSWEQSERELLGGDGDIPVGPQSHEYGSYIIHSLATNTPRVIYGNVPNRGLITNLMQGACVELPCLVDGNGIQPTYIGALPPQLAALCQTNINVQSLTVEAALTGKREHIYHAVMLDPHTATVLTLDKIWEMCDELIEAHQKDGVLGQFKPVIRDTGRGMESLGCSVIASLKSGSSMDYAPGAGNRCELEIENRGLQPEKISFSLKSDAPEDTLSLTVFTAELTPGETVKKQIDITFKEGIARPRRVYLASDNRKVLCQDLFINPRTTLSMSAGAPAEFPLVLAGNPAGNGKLALRDGMIHLELTVQDSNVETDFNSQPWLKSCIELFFAPDDGITVLPEQFFILPAPSKPVIWSRNFLEVTEADVRLQMAPLSYTVQVCIPAQRAGIPADAKSFLFDCYCTLMAHGEAHSGGRLILGGPMAHESTTAYLRVVVSA